MLVKGAPGADKGITRDEFIDSMSDKNPGPFCRQLISKYGFGNAG